MVREARERRTVSCLHMLHHLVLSPLSVLCPYLIKLLRAIRDGRRMDRVLLLVHLTVSQVQVREVVRVVTDTCRFGMRYTWGTQLGHSRTVRLVYNT